MAYLGGIHFWWPKMTGRMYPEIWGKLSALTDLRRLQPDVLPAVRPRLPGDAPALPRVPARVPGAQRHVHGRAPRSSPSATSCRWSTCSSRSSSAPMAGAEPLATPRAWSGRPPRRRRPTTSTRRPIVTEGPYDYRAREEATDGEPRLTHAPHAARADAPASLAHHSTTWSSSTRPPTLGMWTFLATEVMFFGGLFAGLHRLPVHRPDGVRRRRASSSTSWLGTINTVVLPDQQPDDGPGRPRRPGSGNAQAQVRYLLVTMVLGDDLPRDQGVRVLRGIRASTWSPA